MPRTKRARSPKPAVKAKDTQQALEVEFLKQKRQDLMQSQLDSINEQMVLELEQLSEKISGIYSMCPTFLLDKTVKQIIAGEVSSQTTVLSDANITSLHNSTRSASATRIPNTSTKTGSRSTSAARNNPLKTDHNKRTLPKKRSLSATYDASSESSQVINTTSTTGRRSRTRTAIKNTSVKPVSRSLSRSAQKTTAPLQYKTPAGKAPNNACGTITPKMKPNTPQVLLRRPKQGEVAISYQGSPLMTGSCFREDVANINIPLPNGDLLSLLPQTGLRPSIIPEVGDDTRRQLEILRDNLIKVCSSMK